MRKLAALLFTPLFLCAAPLDDSVQAAARAITSEGLLAHIRTLASDEFGGRGPGTEGERKTVDYLIEQAKKLGLKPGNPNGTYIQQVPLWSIRSSGSLKLSVQSRDIELAPGQDFLLTSNLPKPEIEIAKAPLVFVGYGVDAPEYKWNDYKHVDVKGKVVVLLSGDPPIADPSDPSKLDEKMFLGKALSFYGRHPASTTWRSSTALLPASPFTRLVPARTFRAWLRTCRAKS